MFKLLNRKKFKSVDAEFIELEHTVTKAKHIHIKNNSSENIFLCGIKTPNPTSDGINHILEHMCYNAENNSNKTINYIEKTLDPNCNGSIIDNLTYFNMGCFDKSKFLESVKIISNALLNPKLTKKLFQQEAFRVEFKENSPDSDISLNGVVFNEMRESFSNNYDYITNHVKNTLYTNANVPSLIGGDVKEFHKLTLEDIKEYHTKYYHPSNMIFITFGNLSYKTIHKELNKILKGYQFKNCSDAFKSLEPQKKRSFNHYLSFPLEIKECNLKTRYVRSFHLGKKDDDLLIVTSFILSKIMHFIEQHPIKLNNISYFINNMFFDVLEFRDSIFVEYGVNNVTRPEYSTQIKEDMDILLQKVIESGLSNKSIKEAIKHIKMPSPNDFLVDVLKSAAAGTLSPDNIELSSLTKKVLKKHNIKTEIKKLIQDKFLKSETYAEFFYFAKESQLIHDQNKRIKYLEKFKNNLSTEQRQNLFAEYKEFANSQINSNSSRKSLLRIFNSLKTAKSSSKIDFLNINFQKINYQSKTMYNITSNFEAKNSFIRSFIYPLKAIEELLYLNIYKNYLFDFNNNPKKQKFLEKHTDFINMTHKIINDIKNEEAYCVVQIFVKAKEGKNQESKAFLDKILNFSNFENKEKFLDIISRHNNQIHLSNFKASDLSIMNLDTDYIIKSDLNSIAQTILSNKLYDNIENNPQEYESFLKKINVVHKKFLKSYKNSIMIFSDNNLSSKTINEFFDKKIVSKFDKRPIKNLNTKRFIELNSATYLKDKNVLLSDNIQNNSCAMSIKTVNFNHKLSGTISIINRIIINEYLYPEIREKAGAYYVNSDNYSKEGFLCFESKRDPHISRTIQVFKDLKHWLLNKENFSKVMIQKAKEYELSEFDRQFPLKPDLIIENIFFGIESQNIINHRKSIEKTTKRDIIKAIETILLPSLENPSIAIIANKEQYKKENLQIDSINI